MKPFEVALVAVGKMVGPMTGSKLMKNGDDVLIIQGIKASTKCKTVTITYRPGKDLFDMEFVAKRSSKIETVTDLYVDQLRDLFEQKTGVYASF